MPAKIHEGPETAESPAPTGHAQPFISQDSPAFSSDAPKRGVGGPRKDGAPPKSNAVTKTELTRDLPGPRYNTFYSDHQNAPQRSRAAWTYWNALSPAARELVDAHVYRDWPVMLDPPESEKKFIDKIIGVEPIQNDQDFVNRWGAGDYHLYLNVNPAVGERRTLFTVYVKCSHDFRAFPPTDRRIDNIDSVSLTDPQNASYVAWLRSNGKLPDPAKENEKMAAAVQAQETQHTLAGTVDKLIGRVLDTADKRAEDSSKNDGSGERSLDVMADAAKRSNEMQAETFTSLLNLVTAKMTSNGGDSQGTFKMILDVADQVRKAADPTPYLSTINDLNAKLNTAQLDRLNDKIEALSRQQQNPAVAGAAPAGAPKTLSEQLKEARDLAEELGFGYEGGGGGRSEREPIWLPLAQQALDKGLPLLTAIIMRAVMPSGPSPQQPQQPSPFPGQPQQQQLAPSPQQQPPMPQPQQQATAMPPEQAALQQLLAAISGPVVDFLGRGEGGDAFADYVIGEHGQRGYRSLSGFQVAEIVQTFYQFPLTAPHMIQFPQEVVAKFVTEFKEFDPDKFDAKMSALERK